MFTIIFNDLSKLAVDRDQLLLRDSCFRPLAETAQSHVRYDATDGHCRSALLEYMGTGMVEAQDIEERGDLRSDLEAWAVPVSAWPPDLRLRFLSEEREAEKERSVDYQKHWVAKAVSDSVALVRAASEDIVTLQIIPAAGEFEVVRKDSWRSGPTINRKAFEAIEAGLKRALHMNVLARVESGTVRVSLTIEPPKRRKVANVLSLHNYRLEAVMQDHPVSLLDRIERLERHCGII